jgi:hypothetical protein
MTALLNTTAGNFPTCAAPTAYEGIHVCVPTSGATVCLQHEARKWDEFPPM